MPAETQSQPRVAALYRLQWEPVQEAWVLLYPEGMVKLNGSAGEIMRRLDGQTTVAELINGLEHDFETQGLSQEVMTFLNIAQEQGWITV